MHWHVFDIDGEHLGWTFEEVGHSLCSSCVPAQPGFLAARPYDEQPQSNEDMAAIRNEPYWLEPIVAWLVASDDVPPTPITPSGPIHKQYAIIPPPELCQRGCAGAVDPYDATYESLAEMAKAWIEEGEAGLARRKTPPPAAP
jgi:hypothetical protein